MKKIISFLIILNIFIFNTKTFADNLNPEIKFPPLSSFYVDDSKYEKLNRKIFYFNLKLNKLFARRIHTLWCSIVPRALIDCLNYAYINIEYPKRVVSCLLQKDFDAIKHETKRFIINSTFGLAGLFDVANKYFNLELYNEDMEQALTRCKVKCGSYLVLPFVSSVTSRDIMGRILDFILTPTTYIASPIAAAIKMGLLINRTAYIQPIIKMVESNFIDPYDIAKKVYGVEKYIKLSNYDRKNVIENIKNDFDEIELVDNTKDRLDVKGKISDNLFVNTEDNYTLTPDILLNDFNAQSPVLDSIRTVLLGRKTKKDFWQETSLWNRDFSKKLKTGYVQLYPDRPKYRYKFILQKDKSSPMAIIFPSIGEGADNSHNIFFAKMFYDKGYSVIVLGSHFQWEFLRSLKKNYVAGNIKEDVKIVNLLLDKVINDLSLQYKRAFLSRVAFGTSMGAYCVMFLANNQYETGGNNIDKFIAICPPFSLIYAAKKLDDVIESWKLHPDNMLDKAAVVTAKVMRAYDDKENLSKNFSKMPFSNYEAKLISAFVFHQKLSDLIYQIETDSDKNKASKEIYNMIYTMNFDDYIKKYLLVNYGYDELEKISSFDSISNYLINSDNYKIYHSLDDYLVDKSQLSKLKQYSENKLVLFDHGSHLGFMYRKEFLDELNNDISAFKTAMNSD